VELTPKGSSDVPLLSHILETARQFLFSLPSSSTDSESGKRPDLRVGFVGPTMRKWFLSLASAFTDLPGDPQLPHPHLHVHAMLGPVDKSLPGAGIWRRNVVFGALNWWSIEDLRAEIRWVLCSMISGDVEADRLVNRPPTTGSNQDTRIESRRLLTESRTPGLSLCVLDCPEGEDVTD
jgi:hypothetical protein